MTLLSSTSVKNLFSLKSLRSASAYKALHAQALGEVRTPTSSDLAELAEFVAPLNRAKRQLAKTLRFLALPLARLILCFGGLIWMFGVESFELGATLALLALSAVITALPAVDTDDPELDALAEALQPLKSLEGCQIALALAKAHPACQQYRQEVLSEGREFRKLDLMVMKNLELLAARQKVADRSRRRCQELHAIAG